MSEMNLNLVNTKQKGSGPWRFSRNLGFPHQKASDWTVSLFCLSPVIVDVVMPTVKPHLCFICGCPLKKTNKKSKLETRICVDLACLACINNRKRRLDFGAGEGQLEVRSPENVTLSFKEEAAVCLCSGCFLRSKSFGYKKAITSPSRAVHVCCFCTKAKSS